MMKEVAEPEIDAVVENGHTWLDEAPSMAISDPETSLP